MGITMWCKIAYTNHIFPHVSKGNGTYVVDEQWDNLLILDACRYDVFKETNTIEGKLETRISRGSESTEFLLENFARHPNRTSFDDIVYVAANPLVSSLLRNKFHKIYPVWDYGWDDELNTVPPGVVANEALEVRRRHPDKRMIVHFMQPHFPALTVKLKGETGISGLRRTVKMDLDPISTSERQGPLDVLVEVLLQRGDLDRDDVLFAYKENLRIVLSYVTRLVKDFSGRTVITADHGETFGERSGALYPFRVFGHPRGVHVKQLVVVPWLVIESENQHSNRHDKEERLNEYVYSQEEDAKIKDRLQKLGYL